MLLELQHNLSRGLLKPRGWVIWKVQREQKCCSHLRHMFNVPAVRSLIISKKQCWQSIFSDGLWTLESNPSSIWTQAVGKLEKGWAIQPTANPNLIPTAYYLCSIRVADWTIATVLSNEILTCPNCGTEQGEAIIRQTTTSVSQVQCTLELTFFSLRFSS